MAQCPSASCLGALGGLAINSNDVLLQVVSTADPTSIDEVLEEMEAIDKALSNDDGLKWFNLLYLMVTKAVRDLSPAGGWADERWIQNLDVVFANLYFRAVADSYRDPNTAPRAWQVLFKARAQTGIARVQFALAGMNAHINHDLPIAVVQTCKALDISPEHDTPEYEDFEYVNTILNSVEPEAVQFLATGSMGGTLVELGIEGLEEFGRELSEDLGVEDLEKLRDVLAMWSVQNARETAWGNAEILWQIQDLQILRDTFLLGLDRLTGFAGRGLLISI
jgi:hypothetical protein